jgi:hypothetical protein
LRIKTYYTIKYSFFFFHLILIYFRILIRSTPNKSNDDILFRPEKMNNNNNLQGIVVAVALIIATSLGTVLGFAQSVSAESVSTGASTDFGSSRSASLSDLFEGTPGSVSSSGKDSGSASGDIAICGGTLVIDGVCTEATR